MIANVYAEYLTHPSVPDRIYVSMPKGRTMALTCTAWTREFRNRAACLRWLAEAMPDAQAWAWNGELTECAGSVLGMAQRAGLVGAA